MPVSCPADASSAMRDERPLRWLSFRHRKCSAAGADPAGLCRQARPGARHLQRTACLRRSRLWTATLSIKASTAELGGVDAGITDVLIASMDQAVPFRPNFSVELAGILNGVAEAVNQSASGRFSAPFAKLSFPEKVKVFAFLEGGRPRTAPLRPPRRCSAPVRRFLGLLGGRGLRPGYTHADRHPARLEALELRGVADGRDEFKGYYQDRRKVT